MGLISIASAAHWREGLREAVSVSGAELYSAFYRTPVLIRAKPGRNISLFKHKLCAFRPDIC